VSRPAIPLPALATYSGAGESRRSVPEVAFYFDIVCPYAYLASQTLPTLAHELGATVDYRPILLGGVLKALGSTPAGATPGRLAYTRADLARWSAHLGIELNFPSAHPRRTVEAMRLITAAHRLVRPVLITALYRAYWVDGKNVADPAVLYEVAESVGIERQEAERALRNANVAAELRRHTDDAVAAGVFGVPTFVVEGSHGPRLFFGQDRLHFVREALAQQAMVESQEPPAPVAPDALLTPTSVANEGRRVIFYYDLASPFAYLGATQIERIAHRLGAVVDYLPILLGGLFRSLGTPMVPLHTYSESKQRQTHEDLHRWARYYDVPFRFPHRFPMSTVTAQRLLICAKSRDRIGPLSLALFRAYWADDQDLADPAVLEAALRAVGLPESLLEETVSPAAKEQLHKNTDEAQGLGVFGVPTFVVEQKAGPPALIFGQDRLLFVEKALLGTLESAAT